MFKYFNFVKNCCMENLKKSCVEKIKNNLLSVEKFDLKRTQNKKIFDCFNAVGQEFKNHFAFFGFADNLFDKTQQISNEFLSFYKKLQKTEVGLCVTGCLDVENENISFLKENRHKLKEFANEFHTSGTRLFLGLKTSCGRILADENRLFLTASDFYRECRNVTNLCLKAGDGKLKKLAKKFGKAAAFATKSNFDGIFIDGSLSNLLGEMTSTEFNKRIFGYFSNEIDFAAKILKEMGGREAKLPIIYKISVFSFLKECFDDEKPLSLKGVRLKESDKILDLLANLVLSGIDGFMLDFGTYENQFLSEFSPLLSKHLFGEIYQKIIKFFKESNLKNKFDEDVLLILNDNFCEDFYEIGSQNVIYNITKNILSDENFLKNLKSNKPYKNCILCGACKKYGDELNKNYCVINPNLFFEHEVQFKADKHKKIAVVGAGTSGIVCANEMAKRGLNIDVFEKNKKINLHGRLCEVFESDLKLKNYNDYIENIFKMYQKNEKINLKLSEEFEAQNAKDYDTIILATGFKELFLGVPGAVLKSVVSIFDVLMKKISLADMKNIVIYAKSELSFKLAVYLAKQKHKVTVLVSKFDFLKTMPQNLLSFYLFAARILNIELIVGCEVRNIHEDFVELYENHKTSNIESTNLIMNIVSGKKYGFLPKAKVVDCNVFVYDPDVLPNNRLFYDIVAQGFKGEVYMVGDALETGGFDGEIKSAYFVGNNV